MIYVYIYYYNVEVNLYFQPLETERPAVVLAILLCDSVTGLEKALDHLLPLVNFIPDLLPKRLSFSETLDIYALFTICVGMFGFLLHHT